jgi:hypothetical protein
MRRLGGIVAFQLKRSRTTEVPTRLGKCEVCGRKWEVRYMVAAKLPRYMYLCNEHYLKDSRQAGEGSRAESDIWALIQAISDLRLA